ncbi:MAG: Mor transcription activator family protein, partial [Pseudomonadota bacterium]|nr:Mor transcription activator family protein [Pseudomonadota bacterium]
ALEVRNEAGSSKIYIPGPNRDARNAAIRKEFRGNNLDELARKYDLSRRQVERIVTNHDIMGLKMSPAHQ